MSSIKISLLVITLLFISACGYNLREDIELPEGLKNIYLQSASGQLKNKFRKTLRSSDAALVDDIELAGIVVKISKEKMKRRVLSIGSTGRANEYEIEYRLNFILLDASGNALSDEQNIEISRDYFNDQEDVLGKNNEEGTIKEEMYRQAVQTILRRSRAVLINDVL